MTDSRQPVDIIIFVEHIVREFNIATCLKYLGHQQADDVTIEVCSLPFGFYDALNTYLPRVVLMPSVGFFDDPQTKGRIIHEVWPDTIIVNLAWEQFFHNWEKDYRVPQSDYEREEAIYLAWGQEYVDYLTRNGVNPNQIHVNGNLSCAIYDKPYSNYLPTREDLAAEHGLDASKRWLFFPENYFFAFQTNHQLNGRAEVGGHKKGLYDFRTWSQKSLEIVIDWLQKIALAEDIEIIFRPRPAIPLDRYESLFGRKVSSLPPNLHLIKSGSVKEWVLASELVVSSNSTTMLESTYADKPTFRLAPIEVPHLFTHDWLHDVPAVRTYADLEQFVQSPPAPTPELQAYLDANANKALTPLPGAIAFALDQLQQSKNTITHPSFSQSGFDAAFQRRYQHTFGERVKLWLKRKQKQISLRLTKVLPFFPAPLATHRSDKFTRDDVVKSVATWEEILG